MEGGSNAGGRGAGEGVPAADIEGDELREELSDRQLVRATPEGTEHGAHFFVVTNHHLLLIRRYQSRSEPPKKAGARNMGNPLPSTQNTSSGYSAGSRAEPGKQEENRNLWDTPGSTLEMP